MIALPLALLFVGSTVIITLTAYLIYRWMAVPQSSQGPRFKTVRLLNIIVLGIACLAALAVTTGYYLGGRITFVGLPIIILLFLSSGSPKRFQNK